MYKYAHPAAPKGPSPPRRRDETPKSVRTPGLEGLDSVRTPGVDWMWWTRKSKTPSKLAVGGGEREGLDRSSGGEGGGGNWRAGVGRGANSVHGRAPVLLRRAVLHARRLRQGHGELAARADALGDDDRHHLARVRRPHHELHPGTVAGRH